VSIKPAAAHFVYAVSSCDCSYSGTRNGRCSEQLPGGTPAVTFMRADGSLWLDAFDRYEQLDPATGLAKTREATVRKPGTCARPMPAAEGRMAWAGDTLSLRSFGSGRRTNLTAEGTPRMPDRSALTEWFHDLASKSPEDLNVWPELAWSERTCVPTDRTDLDDVASPQQAS